MLVLCYGPVMKNPFLHVLFGLAAFALANCAGAAPVALGSPSPDAAPERVGRPNVVLIIADDLGWRDVGFMGTDFYETPQLDALAQRGMVFTNAYSASPVCSPSRTAIMTGRDPVRYHITDWIPGFAKADQSLLVGPQIAQELPLEAMTIGEYFREAGYATSFAGKWHLGGDARYWPEAQGFDVNAGGWSRGAPNGAGGGGAFFSPHRNPTLADGPDGEFLTARLGEETARFIAANADRPFLAVHSFYQVHTPLEAAPDHIDRAHERAARFGLLPPAVSQELRYGVAAKGRQDNAIYASMVAAMDETIGRIVAQLEAEGVLGNTIIMFVSDNGGLAQMGPHAEDAPTSNAPLRGGKGWLYEGGIRVPMLLVAPGAVRPGSFDPRLATSFDILPTLLALAGIAADGPFDGLDLMQPQAMPHTVPDRALYWHFPHYHASQWRPGGAIRKGNWKLVEYFEDDSAELFNLAQDPGETTDLSQSNLPMTMALKAELRQWREEMGARMPTVRKTIPARRD